MGIPVLRGRAFTDSDRPPAAPLVVVDETLAREHFAGGNALGHVIQQGPEGAVVGVVGSVRHGQLGEALKATVYFNQRDADWISSVSVVARSSLPPDVLAPQLRAAVRALDPALPLYDVMPMTERIGRSLSVRRLSSIVLGAFAGVALLLAVLGVWGVIGYRMAQRTTEIGIRMALGARPRDVTRMVLGDGLLLAGVGVALGVPLYALLSRYLTDLLYGVGARDPIVIAGAALALALVAVAASWFPARRAARVDPAGTMRG
jgi:ABC-type antimicrobial peptide transport system permease subunit